METDKYNKILDIKEEIIDILNEKPIDKYDITTIMVTIIRSILSRVNISSSDKVRILIKLLNSYDKPLSGESDM